MNMIDNLHNLQPIHFVHFIIYISTIYVHDTLNSFGNFSKEIIFPIMIQYDHQPSRLVNIHIWGTPIIDGEICTIPDTNIAPENAPSQKETSIQTIHFQVLC